MIALFFLPCLFLSCSKKDPVVASFGKTRITLEEYKAAYIEHLKQPNVFDSKALREKFLDELIERRLVAAEAAAAGMAADERFQLRLEANRDKNLRERHYTQVIKPGVVYAESDLEQVYVFMNEERHLRHLYSNSREGADSLYAALQQGVRWEELARLVFADARLSASGGDLGWVAWEQLEYDLAMTAYSLPLQEYSRPVVSSYGWHILQVVDWRKMPLLSQPDYELKRRKARGVLESKLGDKAALAYIGGMMKNKKIQVYPKPLQRVGASLGPLLQRTPSTMDRMRPEQLSEMEMGRIETSLWELRQEALATLEGETLTVGQFIAALNYIPYHAVHKSLKTALDYVLRDRALTREARRMGLERDAQVRLKTELYKQNKLHMARRRDILADIEVTKAETQAYFDLQIKHQHPNTDFAEIEADLRSDLLTEKRNNTMKAYLDGLYAGKKIVKDLQPVHAWYDSVVKK